MQTMFDYIKDKIFSQILPPSEHEKSLRQVIKNRKQLNLFNSAQLFLFVFGAIMVKLALKGGGFLFVYFSLLAIIIVLFIFVGLFKHKHEKARRLINKAIGKIRNNRYNEALDLLLDAYDLSNDEQLFEIILNISKEMVLTPEQDIRITDFMLKNQKDEKTKDKKLQEIISQIKSVSNYILKHKEVIVKSNHKIAELEKSYSSTSDQMLVNEYKAISKRYEDIIELEKSKIDFYSKAQSELLKLKDNHIITQKLMKEKEELKNFEDNLLEKSIEESYNTGMSLNDFISYETAYLQAIQEYSEQISSSSNHNIFEDVIRSFNDKTELIK